MIGKIVVGLLAVVSFSGIFSEAQSSSKCDSYSPKASFANITGFAYAEEYSVKVLPCLTLNIKPGWNIMDVLNAYTATYTFSNVGNLTSSQSSLIENPQEHGQATSYLSNANGTLDQTRTTVIVGYVGDSSGFEGYALAACDLLDGSTRVAILLKSLPPDSDVVSELKAQLPTDLQDITLNVIPHPDNCDYAPH